MNLVRSAREFAPARTKLGHFDLSVEEIRIMHAIRAMSEAFARIAENNPDPARLDYYGYELKKLEEHLDDIRDNTPTR